MFIVKISSIVRSSDTESLDKVSLLVTSEEWNTESNYVVLDYFLVPSETPEDALESVITEHIRETIAHDSLALVSFVNKFDWE